MIIIILLYFISTTVFIIHFIDLCRQLELIQSAQSHRILPSGCFALLGIMTNDASAYK